MKLAPISFGLTHRRYDGLALVLLCMLVVFQIQLWYGRGSLLNALDLKQQLNQQIKANQEAQRRNEALHAELEDLEEGLEIIEEKARLELGMIKPNEIYVRVQMPEPIQAR